MKFLFLALFFASPNLFASPFIEIKNQTEFESYLIENRFNGVLLVAQKDEILFKRAFGVKDFTTNVPLTTEDKFQIGSVSKQFVAAALLKLQEDQKLSLDDEVVKYLPGYQNLKGIKIKDVLNHTAGVANYTNEKSFWQTVDFNKSLTLTDILNFITTLPLEFTPTTKWNYSNSGYIIAGKIVEVVSGQSWDGYIKKIFLEPLKMNNSGYTDFFSQVSNVVGHTAAEGQLTAVTGFNMSWALSAGALYSTVDDMLKWTTIYDSSPLLSENSKEQMQTPFLKNYALGLTVAKFNNDIKISHGGRTPGFTTNLTVLKTSQLKIVKFDNTDGGQIDAAALALNFYAKGFALALKLKPYPIDRVVLNDYVGDYKGDDNFNFKIFIQNDVLHLQPNDGQPAYPLVANDKDCFRLLDFAGEEFIRDTSGIVTGLRHYQGGGVSEFKKVSALSIQPTLFESMSHSRLDFLGL
jgi:CubicO group peptidase (beta-lactamase class C family)